MALKPSHSGYSLLVMVIILLLTQSTAAQFSKKSSDRVTSWEIGFSGGVSKFLTSVNPNSDADFKKFNYWNTDVNPAITLSVIKNFSSKFSAEFEWMTTKLSGQWDENNDYPVPPLALSKGLPYPGPFKTGINQLNLMVVANLNQIVMPKSTNKIWYLFVKAGIGAAFLNDIKSLYPYGKPALHFENALIYGGGLSYMINEKIKLKLGATWHTVNTDRLDGVHELKQGGSMETDAGYVYNVRERYLTPNIGMTYGFGQPLSKSQLIRRSNKSSWFKPAARKYKQGRK